MTILFASDLHIGDYKSKHELFLEFLQKQSDVDKLFFLGDLFDLWVARSDRVMSLASPLLKYVGERFGDHFIYLVGNHDDELKTLGYLYDRLFVEFDLIEYGKKIKLLHGHHMDTSVYVNKLTFLAKLNARIVNYTDRFFNMDMRKWLSSLSDHISDDPYDKMLFTFEFNVKQAYAKDYDFVITGHTHMPCIKRAGDCVHLNTGDWMQHETAIKLTSEGFFLMDYKDRNISIMDCYLFEDKNENSEAQVPNEGPT